MTSYQERLLNDFLDGLPTAVYLKLTAYHPVCMDYDGIEKHVPGIAVQALSRDLDGGIWHEGIVLVPLIEQSYTTLMGECYARCSLTRWISGAHADWGSVVGR